MGPIAIYISNDGDDFNGDGSYGRPYRTLEAAKNGVALDNPNPHCVFYEKSTGRLLDVMPKDVANKWTFVQYVGM